MDKTCTEEASVGSYPRRRSLDTRERSAKTLQD